VLDGSIISHGLVGFAQKGETVEYSVGVTVSSFLGTSWMMISYSIAGLNLSL
jgi:hypothetical protein